MSGGFSQAAGFANLTAYASDGTQQGGTTIVTQSASANTKGSWVSLGTLTTDAAALIPRLTYLNNNGTDSGVSFDIGVGASGSQIVYIANINLAQPQAVGLAALNIFQHAIPVSLPAKTQIWARASCNLASSTPTLGASFVSIDNALGVSQEFYGVDTIGASATAGRGVSMTGGNGAKGTYASVGFALNDYSGFFLCFDYALETAGMKTLVDISIGASGSQVVVLPNIVMGLELGFTGMDLEYYPIQIPAGSNIWARSCNLDGSTAKIGVTFYGVY